MKATYFFSQEQYDNKFKGFGYFTHDMNGDWHHDNSVYQARINGVIFSEVQTQEGEHKSGWGDAVIVHVEKYLPVTVHEGYGDVPPSYFADTSIVKNVTYRKLN